MSIPDKNAQATIDNGTDFSCRLTDTDNRGLTAGANNFSPPPAPTPSMSLHTSGGNVLEFPASKNEAIQMLEKGRSLFLLKDWRGADAIATSVSEWLKARKLRDPRLASRVIGLNFIAVQAALDLVIGIVENLKSSTDIKSWNRAIVMLKDTKVFMQSKEQQQEVQHSLMKEKKNDSPSFELSGAKPYNPVLDSPVTKLLGLSPREIRVLNWLKDRVVDFVTVEKEFRIDRRAVAGAIAWEAIENRRPPPGRWSRGVGPGKMHYKEYGFWEVTYDTLAKQVEDAGYLPRRSTQDRVDFLAEPPGAIRYIAASMRAAADIAWKFGYDIYFSPGVLTAFYQAYDLKKWGWKMITKKAKRETGFTLKDPMGVWVDRNLAFLELAVGKPRFI